MGRASSTWPLPCPSWPPWAPAVWLALHFQCLRAHQCQWLSYACYHCPAPAASPSRGEAFTRASLPRIMGTCIKEKELRSPSTSGCAHQASALLPTYSGKERSRSLGSWQRCSPLPSLLTDHGPFLLAGNGVEARPRRPPTALARSAHDAKATAHVPPCLQDSPAGWLQGPDPAWACNPGATRMMPGAQAAVPRLEAAVSASPASRHR